MVSIIIPVYNVEKYIKQCLESIFNQTYKEYEVIIIDDGSTDSSNKIINSYIGLDNIIILNQENKGVSEARNLGLKKATGEYIVFIDPDDYLQEDYLEKMVNKIKKTNSDVVICGFKSFYDDNRRKSEFNLYKLEDKIYSSNEVINLMLELKVKGYVWDKMFKRENLINNNFRFEPGRYVQDWFPIFKEIYNSSKITFLNEILYNYRLRNGSTVHKKNMKVTEDYYHAVEEIKTYIREMNIDVEKKSYNTFYINTFYNLIRNFYLANKNKKVYKNFYDSKYKENNISISKIIFNNNVDIKVKIKILLWKFRVFHILYPE